MAPVLDELADEMAGQIKITKINVDDPAHLKIAQEYRISSIPNMKLFRNGSTVKEFIGSRPKDAFKQELESALR
jgi:thioredoxin 1